MRSIVFMILIFFIVEGIPGFSLGGEISGEREKRLSLSGAIELAMRRNPNVRLSAKTYESAYARIGETWSNFLPQLELDLTYTRATSNFAPQPTLGIQGGFGFGGPNDISYDNYNATFNLRQLLYDFGKLSSQVQSVKKLAESTDIDRKTTAAALVLNVKQAYYGLLQSLRIQGVDEETVKQMETHLEQAEGFFKAGSKPKFDVTKARVDLTNAKLNLIKARNNVQIARVTLNNAMGMPVDYSVDPEDQLAFNKEEIAFEAAQRTALEQRPELLSVRLKKESNFYTLQSTRRQYYPTLTAAGGYNYHNQEFPLIENWNIGATLAFPFFSGFQTKKQVDEAQANLEAVSAQEEIQVQNILLEVEQAYLNLTASEEQIGTSKLIVSQAEENLSLAEGRYRAGVGTAIEMTDAEVSLANARTDAIQALYNYNIAQAQLEKAMGSEE
ncbi:MAG: TolC family protein [Nitrospiria bacterium]